MIDKIPFGAILNKALTIKTGQTHVQHELCEIAHRLRLEDAPKAYETFNKKQDNCIKLVLRP